MIILPVSSVISQENLDILRQDGLLVLTQNDSVCAAVIALSSDPNIQRQTLDRLQKLLSEQQHSDRNNSKHSPKAVSQATTKTATRGGSTGNDDLPETPTSSSGDFNWMQTHADDWQAVRDVIYGQRPGVQKLLGELLPMLMSGNARVKSTKTAGGDLRFYFTRVNFAEIRFQSNSLVLRLRVGASQVDDPELKYCNGVDGSLDIGSVRVDAGSPANTDVKDWIKMSKEFTKQKN